MICLNVRHFRLSIGLFLVKIENEMQRWSTWQSRFKTRNSFAIQLFASITGTFRSLIYYQTFFEDDLSQRPSFQIINWTIFGEDREWNAVMVNIAITIQNSNFVHHSAVCIVNRYVSFTDLLSNVLRGWFVSTSVISDFQLDYFWWRYSMRRWCT